MTPFIAKLIWFVGVCTWYLIRFPHSFKARHVPKAFRLDQTREWILLGAASLGLSLIPMVYLLTGEPAFADRQFRPVLAWGGAVMFAGSLWLFYLVHRDLGKNWSFTLELRKRHTLVTDGLYRQIRHPMYSAFWLWALAQMLLLPNWVAGSSGLIGFGTLFFLRVGREEQMMIERFGQEYLSYMARTKRIIPGIF